MKDYLKFKHSLQMSGLIPESISPTEFTEQIDEVLYFTSYINEVKSNDSLAIFQSVFPCLELVEFCKCTSFNAIKVWQTMNMNVKLGEYVFYTYIVPIIKKLSEDVGCDMLMLYAADTTKQKELIHYYITALNMDYPDNIISVKPEYDINCPLLVQKVDVILDDAEEFILHLQEDKAITQFENLTEEPVTTTNYFK